MRFPEFSGEWEKATLQSVATLSKGTGISKDQLSEEGQPCILYGELYTKYNSEIIDKIISKTDIDPEKLVRSQANDVIIPCSGESAVDIATARCVKQSNILLGGDLNIIRLKGEHDGSFFAYQLNGKRKYDIAKVAQGVSVVHLYGEHLKGVKVNYPSAAEQKKISSLLALIDQRIETQKKVIEDLKRLKYAISKRVFSEMGQHHPVVKLGQLCSIKTGKLDANAMIDNGEFPFFTCAREDYRTDTYAFEGDSLLISGNGDIGIVKRYNGKFNAYQRTYVLQDFIQEIAYVQCFVEHHLPKRVLKEKNVGAMPYIVLSTLSEMPIILPPTYIQNAICKTIGAISEQINVEEKILANFELQKQYNLSMMFI